MNVKLSIYESKKVKIERLVKYIILLLDTIVFDHEEEGNYSDITAPLRKMLVKEAVFRWSEEAEASYQNNFFIPGPVHCANIFQIFPKRCFQKLILMY